MEVSQDFRSAPKYSTDSLATFTKSELTVYATISFLVVLWCNFKWNRRRFERVAAKMKGPQSYPIIGSGLEFVGSPQREYKNAIRIREFSDKIKILFFTAGPCDLLNFKVANNFFRRNN